MLQLANGDMALEVLQQAQLPGTCGAWSDVLDLGPLQGAPATRAFREQRAAFLAELAAQDVASVRAQLEAWDAALLLHSGEVCVWVELDLCCQLALVHHLVVRPVSYVVRAKPIPSHAPAELAALFEHRIQPSAAAVGLARAAWEAVTSPDPRAVIDLLDRDTLALPLLAPALRRHLEELPDAAGLSLLERRILERWAPSFAELFARVTDPVLSPTDLRVATEIGRFERAGLIADGAVTEAGRAALHGRLDALTVLPPRWLGGVRIDGPTSPRRPL